MLLSPPQLLENARVPTCLGGNRAGLLSGWRKPSLGLLTKCGCRKTKLYASVILRIGENLPINTPSISFEGMSYPKASWWNRCTAEATVKLILPRFTRDPRQAYR